MNKKSIAALAIAATMTLGVGASSYAWFTSTATSNMNKFQAGTLGVTTSITNPDKTDSLDLLITNMECGTSATYTYTVDNLKDKATNTPSSLDLHFTNAVVGDDDTSKLYDNLLEVAKFDLTVTGTTGAALTDGKAFDTLKGTDLSFSDLTSRLNSEVKLNGGTTNSVTYTIVAKLPEELTTGGLYDNEYQGKPGSITITANAHQTNFGVK